MEATSIWNKSVPLVIAHRGASFHAPENTIAAFRMAAELGADAVEMDAKLTIDGQVVVHHDLILDRTTTGTGPLSARTLEELQRLDAGSHFDLSYAGEHIPTLQEVFRSVADRLLINIELSNYASPFNTLPEAVVKLVQEFGLEKRVLLSSFNPVGLRRVRKLTTRIPIGLLVRAKEPGWLRAFFSWLTPNYEAFHPSMALVSEEIIEGQHRKGRWVNVWTVNELEYIKRVVYWGVDGVITDAPDLAREVVREIYPENGEGDEGEALD